MRTCDKGHRYHKTSDCPTCPVCEAERAPEEGFLAALGAPARRALEQQGITSPQLLARYSRDEILALHGMGPASMPRLEQALAQAGLDFRDD